MKASQAEQLSHFGLYTLYDIYLACENHMANLTASKEGTVKTQQVDTIITMFTFIRRDE